MKYADNPKRAHRSLCGVFLLTILSFGFASHTPAAFAQQAGSGLSTYLTMSTDFPHRGISQTDESAALQLGVDFQHQSGFFIGAWVSNVEYVTEASRADPRDIELDYYGGYSWQTSDWSLAATLARYTYPGASVSYDYTELSGSLGFQQRFFYTVSYTDGLLAQTATAINHEFGIELPLPWSTQFDASVGRFDSADVQGGAYDHWNLGFSKQVHRLGLDLRYYDTDYTLVSHLGTPLRESWVFSVSYTL
jgi:uncharacterized protein (TIGR02001 family)